MRRGEIKKEREERKGGFPPFEILRLKIYSL